jgi:hypothetical protein
MEQGMSGNNAVGSGSMGIVQGNVSPGFIAGTVQLATLDTTGAQKSSNESMKATYSYSTAAFATTTSITDLLILLGAAGKKIKLARVGVTGRATASGDVDFVLNKLSAAPTGGGISGALARIPHDSADAASSAVVKSFASVSTPGTIVGQLRSAQANLSAIGSGGAAAGFTWEFGWTNDKMPVLNSATECFSIACADAVPAGALFNIYFEWTEE